MKKILLIILATAGFTMNALAQTSGGPDLYGNVWRDSNDPNGPTYNWVEISNAPGTVEVSGLADDNVVGPFFLPSPFQYYWYTVDKIWIGSNGYIAFGNTQFSHPFPVIPTPNTSNNFIAPLMTDLNFVNTGTGAGNPANCYYWVSPNEDSVVVTFDSVPFWQNGTPAYTGENTFQIILSYIDSTITFQYMTQSGASVSTLDYVTVGIENNSGNDGLQWNHDVYAPSLYAIKFYPPTSTTQLINDASTSSIDNPTTGAVFLSKNLSGSFSLSSEIKNTGNTTLNPFSISGIVRQVSNNALQVSNTTTSDTLQPGQSQILNFANPFLPINAGAFKLVNTTGLAGDATPSNDARTLEIQVVDTTLVDIELKYDNDVAAANGISWNGGDGGCANFFIPPFYPCDITKVSAHIVADPNGVGYVMKVLDDDGPFGSAYTVLDSVFVAPGSFSTGIFTTTLLNQAVRIDSGGFYVSWEMAGDGVALGQNQVAPFSNRTFEILSGVMAEYRYREIEDLMIRATITRVGVGIDEETANNGIGQFYPNPANNLASINIDATTLTAENLQVQLYDMKGSLVRSENIAVQNGQLELSLNKLETGLYTVRFVCGNTEVSRKLNVVK